MIRFAIHRPVAISMLFIALMLVGVVSFKRIPVDLLPSITYPRLTVLTSYEDIPAEDLERLVTEPLEEVVTALSGVRRVVSRTREGTSMITVEYEWERRWTSPICICAKPSTVWPSARISPKTQSAR